MNGNSQTRAVVSWLVQSSSSKIPHEPLFCHNMQPSHSQTEKTEEANLGKRKYDEKESSIQRNEVVKHDDALPHILTIADHFVEIAESEYLVNGKYATLKKVKTVLPSVRWFRLRPEFEVLYFLDNEDGQEVTLDEEGDNQVFAFVKEISQEFDREDNFRIWVRRRIQNDESHCWSQNLLRVIDVNFHGGDPAIMVNFHILNTYLVHCTKWKDHNPAKFQKLHTVLGVQFCKNKTRKLEFAYHYLDQQVRRANLNISWKEMQQKYSPEQLIPLYSHAKMVVQKRNKKINIDLLPGLMQLWRDETQELLTTLLTGSKMETVAQNVIHNPAVRSKR